jgi:hypothetical protein
VVSLGAPSGIFMFVARMMQKGLLKRVIDSIFRPSRIAAVISTKSSIYTQFDTEHIESKEISSYAELFTSVTSKV